MLVLTAGAIGETAGHVRGLLGRVPNGAVVLVSGVLKTPIYIDLLGTGLE